MEQDIQTYVIHCDKHKERLLNIESHLKVLIPDCKIWKGIIPFYEDIKEETNFKCVEKLFKNYDDNITLSENYDFSTLGEIGCYLSHLSLIRYIKNIPSTSKYTVILEDDTTLSVNYKETITSILSDFQEFDMIYLGTSSESNGERLRNQLYVYNFDNTNTINGTFGYVLNNAKAEKIYNFLLNVKEPIDSCYSNLIFSKNITAYIVRPFLANYDRTTFYSTVQNNNAVKNSIVKKNSIKRKLTFADKIIKCMNIIVNNWLIREDRILKNDKKFKNNNSIIKINMREKKFRKQTPVVKKSKNVIKHENIKQPDKIKRKNGKNNRFKFTKNENKNEKVEKIVVKDNKFTIRSVKILNKNDNTKKIKLTIMTKKNHGKSPYIKK